jgi:enamine deaminase RidA (YjgF/YER057c/UK114 family)
LVRIAAAIALTHGTSVAAEGARQRASILMSEDADMRRVQEQIGWSDAVVIDGTVHVSGVVVAMRAGETGPEPAFSRAFVQLGRTLERAGATWGDVVEIRSYHTDPAAQIETMAAVKSRYMRAPHPAWTAVGTTQLLQPRGIAEIALTARLRTER